MDSKPPNAVTATAENAPTMAQFMAAVVAQRPTGRTITDTEGIAKVLGVSVAYIKQDRRAKQLIPFFRLGKLAKYDVDRVLEVAAKREVGGQPAKRKRGSAVEKTAA